MQTFQMLNEMDPVMSQERKHTKGPFSLPDTCTFRPTNINDQSFPRSFQQPLAMNSPLPTEHFAVWPPTPRNTTNENRLPANEAPYPFSMSEDVSSNGTTTSPWGNSSLSVTPEQPPMTSSMEIPQQYGSPLQNSECNWSRPRSDYILGGISSGDEGRLGSSYGSSAGMLGPSSYPYTSRSESDQLSLNTDISRPLSDAGSLSSAEAVTSTTSTDITYYDDTPFMSGPEYTTHRNHPMGISTTPISPAMSPGRMNNIRGPSRHPRVGSQSPLVPAHRIKPYDKSDPNRIKRWSDGYYSPVVDPQLQGSIPSNHSSPTGSSSYPAVLLPNYLSFNSGRLAPPFPGNEQIICIPSNGTHEPHHSHYAEFSEPPDLYSSLNEEAIPPPPEDMNPEDPDMIPHEQDLRFDGDLYTPRWVRGHGNKREGWCGICKPGRWLVLKNSAFWYDKSFTHGISAATGLPFNEPRDMRRMDGNPDVWEGLCHSCNDWVPLVSNKKKGTTWFRHAYKCHTHNKVKDAPKRRRESHGKAASAAAAKAKAEALKAEY